jgi:pyridoxine 4-dehydrogenase
MDAWVAHLIVHINSSGLTLFKPENDEQSFAAMKAAVDAGATFWNAGVFYGRGPNGESTNIQLLARFFAKYPEYADKVFLSVKGGLHMNFEIDGSEEFMRQEVDGVLKILDGKKKLDMFECARVDPKTYLRFLRS